MTYPWFRCYNELVDDPKVARLTPEERWAWVALLCIANASRERGRVSLGDGIPFEACDLAHRANISEAAATSFLEKAAKLKMIAIEQDAIVVINFDKRQYDNPSDMPDATKARKQKQRLAEALSRDARQIHDNVTSMSRHVTSSHDTDTDSDTDNTKESHTHAPATQKVDVNSAADLYRKLTGTEPTPAWAAHMRTAVGDGQADLERWGQVIVAYTGTYTNRSNIKAMLEYYQRNEMPGTRKDGDNGSHRAAPRQSESSNEPSRISAALRAKLAGPGKA